MPRFFVSGSAVDEENSVIKITDDDARHIARSLRMAVGDGLTVCDGSSREYLCELTRIRDEECECKILSSRPAAGEAPLDITLCMAYPKGDKLETVIQKAVELGASRIVPFESSRCIKRPKAEKLDKVVARLTRIAEEAAKQCGRAKLPCVLTPVGYSEMLRIAGEAELSLFCYEGERERSLKSVLKAYPEVKSVSVIIGAEGGFSADEAEAACRAGALSISLGDRILRCETAPSYVLSAISYEYEMR